MLPPWAFPPALRRLRADAPPEVDAPGAGAVGRALARVIVTPPSQWAPSLTTSTWVLTLPLTRPVDDLEAPAAVDVTLVVAADDDVVRLDGALRAGLRADDQGSLALDLALRLAFDAEVAVADVLAVEARMGIDHRLVAPITATRELASWLCHISLTRQAIRIQVPDDVLRERLSGFVSRFDPKTMLASSGTAPATAWARSVACSCARAGSIA